jgi:glutamine cyclotransferase
MTNRLAKPSFFLTLALLPVLNAGCSCSDNSKSTRPPTTVDTTVTYTYLVVNVYPHDKWAFTQGLVFRDTLYEGTGTYGGSSIRKVHLETGAVLQIRYLPSIYFFGEGITIWEDKILQLTWRDNVGFIYDWVTFDSLGSFTYPTEGWGLTHDGTHLIMSDGTDWLRFWDPVTFLPVDSIQVYEVRPDTTLPVTGLNELEYINGKIYANVYMTDRIAIISPDSGKVEAYIDLAGLLSPEDISIDTGVLNGIAYDEVGGRLFVTGKYWPKLFEIDVVPR